MAAMEVVKEADAKAEVVNDEQLSKPGIFTLPPAELLGDDEEDDWNVELQAMRAAVAERREAMSKATSVASGSAGAAAVASASASASSSAPVSGGKIWVAKPKGRASFTQKQASKYFPPDSYITKGSKREVYWQVRGGLPAFHAQQESGYD